MPYGYNGKILHVDLTEEELTVEEPEEKFYRKYMGGSALALYYILNKMPARADPLGPENVLVFALSVITGAAISGQSRLTIAAKSPRSGAIGDSQSGGYFPAEMKAAGFDAIVVTGKSSKPVYLWIKDGEPELRDASHLWGKETGQVEDILREELGTRRFRVVQVGPAGEKMSLLANVMSDTNHANGRTSMGAVMGSKNLKAVVVSGRKKPPLADPKKLTELARWGAEHFEDSDVYSTGLFGTAGIIPGKNKSGELPSFNYSSGRFEGAEKISGQRMAETILKGRETCYACVVRCKRVVDVKGDRFSVDPRFGGPEYETLATFGSYCGIDDLEAIAKANEICARYGLDTISTGATIAWAMDAYEHGLLTREETDGLDLRFGNAEAMLALLEKIAKREGFGAVLADGSAYAAERLGKGQDLVVAVKRQELPAHMPQTRRSLGLIYAVNPFGADHQSSEHDPLYEDPGGYRAFADRMVQLDLLDPQPPQSLGPGKVRYALYTEIFYSLTDSINVCQFVFGPAWQLYSPEQLAEVVRAVTGWDVTLYELMKVGERRLNMLRAFNAREGFTREDDKLPPKLYQPLKGGKTEGWKVTEEEIERAKDVYYAMAGWDENGVPTRAKLEELSIGWVSDLLSR